ncbi:MerR family DNA-binding transcriptional regulator, partial [Clostridium senegalense]
MKNKILIGEMAKLHNVSTQTLRYYDKIGLFKPQ